MPDITREMLRDRLWTIAQSDDPDRVRACNQLAKLYGYNRGEDYSDLQRDLEALKNKTVKQDEPLWYEREH
jgi:hypothetical protein